MYDTQGEQTMWKVTIRDPQRETVTLDVMGENEDHARNAATIQTYGLKELVERLGIQIEVEPSEAA